MVPVADLERYVSLRIALLEARIADEHEANLARSEQNRTIALHVEENLKLRFELNDRAMVLASISIDKRLESMNEFREQLNQQAAQFATRREIEDKFLVPVKAIELNANRLNAIESKMSNLEGKIWAVGASFGVVVTIINIALHFVK